MSDDASKRRFGRNHALPCNDPTVLTCARWRCQTANKCQRRERRLADLKAAALASDDKPVLFGLDPKLLLDIDGTGLAGRPLSAEERLLADLRRWPREAAAEIERLRAAVHELEEAVNASEAEVQQLRAENAALEDTIDRLKAENTIEYDQSAAEMDQLEFALKGVIRWFESNDRENVLKRYHMIERVRAALARIGGGDE